VNGLNDPASIGRLQATIVQELAGHHSLAVTQMYAHPDEADLRRAVAVLGNRGP
jgi:site-specific recombinase XerD